VPCFLEKREVLIREAASRAVRRAAQPVTQPAALLAAKPAAESRKALNAGSSERIWRCGADEPNTHAASQARVEKECWKRKSGGHGTPENDK